MIASWNEASPAALSQAPSEACASTLGHMLGCLQCLLASLDPARQAQLSSQFCPKLARHLPAQAAAGPCSPTVRTALQDLNLAYLRFSLQAAETLLAQRSQVRAGCDSPARFCCMHHTERQLPTCSCILYQTCSLADVYMVS